MNPLEQFKIPCGGPIFGISTYFVNLFALYEYLRSAWQVGLIQHSNSALQYTFMWQIYLSAYMFVSQNTQISYKYLKNNTFTGLMFALLYFVLILNMTGMTIFGRSETAQFISVLALALLFVMWWVLIGVSKNSEFFLGFFFPSGSPLALAFLIIPIEIISFLFRAISLSTRLFANIMAGHTLLKIIATFSWTLFEIVGYSFGIGASIAFFLIFLIALEFGVALVQAYVFISLVNLYYEDARFII